ncbi:MAG: ABC transporter ATP-binding protein [Geminicoccaceae bacterium]
MEKSVEINGIHKSYGTTRSLDGVSLEIRAGEFMTLVGPSGCGKSTLLRIIAGLLPQSAGEIRIAGASIDHLPPKARDLAMVFQSYALYPHMTVADNIATPLRARRLGWPARLPLLGRLLRLQQEMRRQIRADVEDVARLVEVSQLLDRKPAALSGGQRQRVALARAIVRHPKVFLMDEPLSNLDARLRVSMRGEITALHKRLGATFIYVTHDQVEAMTMSDRVAVMMDGRIVQCARPQELYEDPRDLRVARFIGSPEINVLPAERLAEVARDIAPALHALPEGTQIAFRPEALKPAGDGVRLDCRLQRTERLGHEVLLFLGLDGWEGSLTARMTSDEFARLDRHDDRTSLCLTPQEFLAFDAAGHRVTLDAAALWPASGRAFAGAR